MASGPVSVLVKCGALPPLKRGPSTPQLKEEANRIKTEQMAAAGVRRRALIREALENGQPKPVFKRGRPPKYTPEEAIAAKTSKDKGSGYDYNKRVKTGIANLEAMYGTHDEHLPSTDEHFFVAAN